MRTFKVTVNRLIGEECTIYVRATNEAEAQDKALDEAIEVGSTVWTRDDSEPHTYTVWGIVPGEDLRRQQ